MQRLAWVVVAACAHAPARAPVVQAPVAAASAPVAASPWASVPVRVMTWTPHGVDQIGALPGTLPAVMPARWYVEPIAPLDAAAFTRLIALVRDEQVAGAAVPGLSLRGQAVAAWLDQLRALPALTALVLDATDVDGAALAQVALALTRLYLAHTAIDDAAVTALAARYPALEVLDVEDTAVGDPGARAIATLAGLHAIDLAATQITDDGGAALAALGQLEIADLGNTRVAGKTVAALARLPVHELFLDHTRVRGEVAALAALAPALVRFDLSGTAHHPSDAELAWLAGAPNLVELGVSGARLHDPLAQKLAVLPRLRELRMAELPITRATIRVIAARSDLEEVDLAGTPVDDASAAALLATPNLRILRLDATPITDAALVTAAPGAALTELYVSFTQIGDRGLAVLDALPRLTALGVGHTQLGDASLERIARRAQLHTLVLSNAQVAPDALARLAALHELERLYLDHTHADDAVLAALASGRAPLRVLHLEASEISDAALPALRAFAALDELTLGDTRLHAGAAALTAWPRLRTLSLVGLELGDAAIPLLAARPSLVALDLSATEIRDPSPLAALPHLRTLGVAQTKLSPAGVASLKRLTARGVTVVQ